MAKDGLGSIASRDLSKRIGLGDVRGREPGMEIAWAFSRSHHEASVWREGLVDRVEDGCAACRVKVDQYVPQKYDIGGEGSPRFYQVRFAEFNPVSDGVIDFEPVLSPGKVSLTQVRRESPCNLKFGIDPRACVREKARVDITRSDGYSPR